MPNIKACLENERKQVVFFEIKYKLTLNIRNLMNYDFKLVYVNEKVYFLANFGWYLFC